MRIISKYSDYYDSIMRMGFDENIVFVRKGAEDHPLSLDLTRNRYVTGTQKNSEYSQIIQKRLNKGILSYRLPFRSKRRNIWDTMRKIHEWFENSKKYRNCKVVNVTGFIVGFCGKFYVIYELVYSSPNSLSYKKFFFMKEDHPAFGNSKVRPVIGEEPELFKNDINQMFLDLDCPIFCIEIADRIYLEQKLIRNPILKNIEFQKLVDPYTAYQELSMFFGSVFANDEDNMVSISDDDKAASKGFDEWSFKKHPTKKRA